MNKEEIQVNIAAARAFCEKWSDSVRYTFKSGRDLYSLALDAKYNEIFA